MSPRSFKNRLFNNIAFIENVLESYPTPEKPPHCQDIEAEKPAKKKLVSVTQTEDEDGKKTKRYEFDEKTNQLAFPKLTILQESKRMHEEMLRKFLADARTVAALASDEKCEIEREPLKIPTKKQIQLEKKRCEMERIRNQHGNLVERTDRLITLVHDQLQKIEQIQV